MKLKICLIGSILKGDDVRKNWRDWKELDVIYLLGGEQSRLKSALLKNSFDIEQLKPDVHLVGDSAGSMVLSAYFYNEDKGIVTFHKGLYPNSNLIVIVHADNEHYAPGFLFPVVDKFAEEHKLELLKLNENKELTR